MKRYLYLLKLTLIEAMVIAKDCDNPIQVLFSCRILALATFRIPTFGDILMSALLDLQPSLHLSIPDIRYDVFNEVIGDDCFSCTLTESESVSEETSSITKSYSYSYGPSTLAFSTDMAVSTDLAVSPDYESNLSSSSNEYYSSEYTSESESEDENENEVPMMVFSFEEIPMSNIGDPLWSNPKDPSLSNSGDPLFHPQPLDSIRNQQDAIPEEIKMSPSIHESDFTPDVSPLRVVDYSFVTERLCEESLRQYTSIQHAQFTSNYPSLFFWCVLPDPGVNAGTRSSWHDCFLHHPSFTLSFIRCWCDLCYLYHFDVNQRIFCIFLSFIAMLFAAIPGYFVILRFFLPILQSMILHQYHCGLTRSHTSVDCTEYVIAVLKASESMLMNPDLIKL